MWNQPEPGGDLLPEPSPGGSVQVPQAAEGRLLPRPVRPCPSTPAGRHLPDGLVEAGPSSAVRGIETLITALTFPLSTALLAELVKSPHSSLNNPDSQGKWKKCFSNIIIVVVLFSKRCLSVPAQHTLHGPSWGSLPSTRHADTQTQGLLRNPSVSPTAPA